MITAAQQHAQRHRASLFVEDGELLTTEKFAGDQYVMRIRAPKCAAAARPGSFVHVTCDDSQPMRRPLSIMRVCDDWIEVLYKIVGGGLRHLAEKCAGDTFSILGPIGEPFLVSPDRQNPLLIGGGVGIPPMVFLADHLRQQFGAWTPLAILGSELPFPFSDRSSTIETPWLDASINRTMPLLEDWGIACRLATKADFDGCFDGYVTELAEQYLATLSSQDLQRTAIFSCGPTPMLKAVATLAEKFGLPCQVSLEEFMACAVGGCAGCVVEIDTSNGHAMKRVCVDGPVFEANTVVWE